MTNIGCATPGYTPQISNIEKARNLAARLRKAARPSAALEVVTGLVHDHEVVDDKFVATLETITRLYEAEDGGTHWIVSGGDPLEVGAEVAPTINDEIPF